MCVMCEARVVVLLSQIAKLNRADLKFRGELSQGGATSVICVAGHAVAREVVESIEIDMN